MISDVPLRLLNNPLGNLLSVLDTEFNVPVSSVSPVLKNRDIPALMRGIGDSSVQSFIRSSTDDLIGILL